MYWNEVKEITIYDNKLRLTLTWDVLKFEPYDKNGAYFTLININMRCIEIQFLAMLFPSHQWLTLTWDVLKYSKNRLWLFFSWD